MEALDESLDSLSRKLSIRKKYIKPLVDFLYGFPSHGDGGLSVDDGFLISHDVRIARRCLGGEYVEVLAGAKSLSKTAAARVGSLYRLAEYFNVNIIEKTCLS